MKNLFYKPENDNFNENDVWQWYNNVKLEIESINFTKAEKKYIEAYYSDAGILSSKKTQFFRTHYSKTFYNAASFLLNRKSGKVILDLGAGTGTQSLFFAIQDAKVIAVDLDSVALGILQKRKNFYENKLRRKLDIKIINKSIFELQLSNNTKIDGIYSMFAFNLMQPSVDLLDKLITYLSNDARFCVIDGNNSHFLTYILPSERRDVLSPRQFSSILKSKGFKITQHHGGVSLPPVFWSLTSLHKITTKIDNILNNFWITSRSHQIMASYKPIITNKNGH